MNLILLRPDEVAPDGRVLLSDERAAHAREVLGAGVGQRLRVGLLDGPVGAALVEAADAGGVALVCCFEAAPPPRPPVDLLLALPRPKVLKRLWAPLAALGVGRILLTNAEKVERMYFDTHVLDPEFYRPRLIEGLQQARDTRVPEISVHRRLKVLVEDELDAASPGALRLVADPAYARRIREAVAPGTGRRLLLAVGPEGGWTDYERDLLERHGFAGVGIGPRILRADTACVALLAVAYEAMREARS